MRTHAIVLALNEQAFIENQLRTFYPFCSAISVLTQYDRDWYGKAVTPDRTAELVLNFPDPDGKIHLVARRFPDEAAARNHEMLAGISKSADRIMTHGSSVERIERFHAAPDYFLIADADEIYDCDTFPRILEYLEKRRPRGMRVHGFNYLRTWNRRVPSEIVQFCHFGFVTPGIRFKMRRTVSWNESRFQKLLKVLHLPDFSARLWGFIECPWEIGYFHHGCWLGSEQRWISKSLRSSHPEIATTSYPNEVAAIPFKFISTNELPVNIREGKWPAEFFDPSPVTSTAR
jgi:hypothetical protein